MTIRMDDEKVWEMRQKAAQAQMSLSDYLAAAGTATDPKQLLRKEDSSERGAATR